MLRILEPASRYLCKSSYHHLRYSVSRKIFLYTNRYDSTERGLAQPCAGGHNSRDMTCLRISGCRHLSVNIASSDRCDRAGLWVSGESGAFCDALLAGFIPVGAYLCTTAGVPSQTIGPFGRALEHSSSPFVHRLCRPFSGSPLGQPMRANDKCDRRRATRPAAFVIVRTIILVCSGLSPAKRG